MAEQLELLILTCIKYHKLNVNKVMEMTQVDITLESEFIEVLMKMAALGYIKYDDNYLTITEEGRSYQADRFSKWQITSSILVDIMQEQNNE